MTNHCRINCNLERLFQKFGGRGEARSTMALLHCNPTATRGHNPITCNEWRISSSYSTTHTRDLNTKETRHLYTDTGSWLVARERKDRQTIMDHNEKLTKPMEAESTWTCIRRTIESDKNTWNTLTRKSKVRGLTTLWKPHSSKGLVYYSHYGKEMCIIIYKWRADSQSS